MHADAGKVFTDSEKDESLQPISVGEICDSGEFLCCSYMTTVAVALPCLCTLPTPPPAAAVATPCRASTTPDASKTNSPTFGGKHVDFAPSDLLFSKRFIHATGVRLSERDHYEILGISKDANRDEIKKAYHALAKKYHPDANKNSPSAKRKFQEIRDAYETLRDPEKKAQYDMTREGSGRTKDAGYSSSGGEQFRYARGAHFSDSFHKIFSEIFENENEGMAGDIEVELAVTFSEAARGCTKHLSFSADVPCDSCDGQGHPLDAEPKVCPTCQGIGRVTIPPFVTTCSTCKGYGRIIKDLCMKCEGSGVSKGIKNVKMIIPAGVDSGDTIRVPKAGNAGGRGSLGGHLKWYQGQSQSQTKKEAILGGNVEVPTLSGTVQLQEFLIDLNIGRNVSERQRAILEEFEEEIIDENSTSAEGSWWEESPWVKRLIGSEESPWVKRLLGPNFMLEFSIFVLILFFLNKFILK
ncbi:hypothetical protein RD792_011143 [Penstemon davidsonii]|uniref:Chaperone protein dnaJ 1, mitochondrial n=1 Tax=Penstemon davidsonii TaxID=160366 RepID=A0ABR0D3S7_9LAMI|nr:hypothetical protein RD792_011143 [Penstemon davidsonii]